MTRAEILREIRDECAMRVDSTRDALVGFLWARQRRGFKSVSIPEIEYLILPHRRAKQELDILNRRLKIHEERT